MTRKGKVTSLIISKQTTITLTLDIAPEVTEESRSTGVCFLPPQHSHSAVIVSVDSQLNRIWNHLRDGLPGSLWRVILTVLTDERRLVLIVGRAIHLTGHLGCLPRDTYLSLSVRAFTALDTLHLSCELKIQNEWGLVN